MKKLEIPNLKRLNAILGLSTILCTVPLTGCTKTMDCDVEGNHIRIYIDEESNLKKYIEGEKETVRQFKWTKEQTSLTKELENVSEENLYLVEDNENYIKKTIEEDRPKREAYHYDYIYGAYSGYDFGLNPMSSGKMEYYFGTHTGYHWDYEWQTISTKERTDDEVRDIIYQFQFYKMDKDGNPIEKEVSSLEELSEDYKYFRSSSLVQRREGEPYYLKDKNDSKGNDLEKNAPQKTKK